MNALVKHFLSTTYHADASLTPLLCGEQGLIGHLEACFQLGLRGTLFSNPFFKKSYAWDFIGAFFCLFFEQRASG